MTSRYVKNPDIVVREESQDGGLLFNPDTNEIKLLNATGLFIWELCDGEREIDAIVAALQDAFDGLPDDEIADQVQAFLEEMEAAGLVGSVQS
jgi:hypothetical protein